jgi:glycosyltransferase involved in cell wall biosynthesis
MKVSVIIPVYNTPAEWLHLAVESTKNQTYKDLQILLIDDCSTDEETKNACQSLEDSDPRVEYYRLEENRGISGALNVGLHYAESEWVFRMDADDIMLPERIQVQMDYLQQNPSVDILGGGLFYLAKHEGNWGYDTNPVIHPSVVDREIGKKSHWFINHPTVAYRKSKILEIGGYDESLRGLPEDYELWCRSLRNELIIHNLPVPLIFLRLSPKSLSQNFNSRVLDFLNKIQNTL